LKVLILNTNDISGGAARSAYRLRAGLQSIGVKANMLVQNKEGGDNAVDGPTDLIGRLLAQIRPRMDKLAVTYYPKRNGMIFSPAIVPDRLTEKAFRLRPDIVHLHWMAHGNLKIESLRWFKTPLVWTLHDSWAFTGGCHVPLDCTKYQQKCGACPALGSTTTHDLSRWIWKRKFKNWQKLNLTLVSPSRWLADCARSSSLFHNVRIEVIQNGLDLMQYRPYNKALARDVLRLPQDKKLILFGAMDSMKDAVKGFHLLLPAIKKLAIKHADQFELVIFGASEPVQLPAFGLKAHYMGRMHDDAAIALMYSAVDVFVSPSLSENLSNTIMESMACGTPCAAFRVGGIPDLIEHERSGYMASPFDPEDLARGIEWMLEDDGRRQQVSQQARAHVERNYSLDTIAHRYLTLYQDVLLSKK